MLRAGLEWLSSQRHTHMTETVVYSRASATPVSVSLSATPLRIARDAASEQNVAINSEFMDWRFRRSDLTANGIAKPRPGDLVTQTIGEDEIVWEVIERDGLPCFGPSDSERIDTTVRTRRVP